jgi:nucleoid-associated protein YgaU
MSEAMRAAASLYNNPRYNSESEVRIMKNRIRRRRIVRRQYMLLAFAVAVVVFLSIFIASTVMTNAQGDDFTPEYKYYTSITVHANDTIWDVAAQNYSEDHYKNMNEYIKEICSINSISDPNRLYAGESLIVPYYSTIYN